MIRELLLGYSYLKTKRVIAESERFQDDRIREMESRLLATTLRHAVLNVSHYRQLGITIRMQDPLEDLLRFPLIEKNSIRSNIEAFVTGPMYRRRRATTGGSTGQPFVFYQDRFITRQREKAFIFDMWGRIGYRFGDPILNIRGRTPSAGRFVDLDRFFNVHYVSSFGLTLPNIKQYVAYMKTLKSFFLHGYPSTAYQLALLFERAGEKPPAGLQGVLCGSERLFPFQRQKIEAVFGCRVFHWYGHSECLSLGGECEHSNRLHFYPQYGFTELHPTGVRGRNGRELHEIVATGFNNPVMPLIRYRTGDYAILSEKQRCSCGRNYLLVDEVVGREQEFVIDSDGTPISATSLIFGQHYELFAGIDELRINQSTPGKIELVIVKNDRYRQEDLDDLRKVMRRLLGERMDVSIAHSEILERSPLGKQKLVNQGLDVKRFLN